MSMDKGHNGRYVYTTIHRQFTVKPVVTLGEKKMTTCTGKWKYRSNKRLVQGIHTNGFSALEELFERSFKRG